MRIQAPRPELTMGVYHGRVVFACRDECDWLASEARSWYFTELWFIVCGVGILDLVLLIEVAVDTIASTSS